MIAYITWNTVIEVICFLISIFCLRTDKKKEWRLIACFLLITVAVEITGIYIKRLYFIDGKLHPNTWLYNLFVAFESGFVSLMFFALLRKSFYGKGLVVTGWIILLFSYAYEIQSNTIYKRCFTTITLMAILFTLYSLFYLYLLLKEEEYINLRYSAEFWWVIGSLCFYFGSSVCNLFYSKLSVVVINPKHTLIYYIYVALNLLLYVNWSYSFICRKWMTSKQ